MIEETYAALQAWNFERTLEENIASIKETNAVGAASANWLRDVCFVLRRRFDPGGRDRCLALLAKAQTPLDLWKPALLYHMTRDEFLVRDFLANWLFDEHQQGTYRVRVEAPHEYLGRLHERRKVEKPWTDRTTREVAGSLLRMAVDFGLMTGKTVKEFASYHLPEESFLYLLHALFDTHGNGRDVVHSPDWRMFLMTPADVERELYRLHQFRKLRFEVAGSLMELTLPCKSALAYVEEQMS